MLLQKEKERVQYHIGAPKGGASSLGQDLLKGDNVQAGS